MKKVGMNQMMKTIYHLEEKENLKCTLLGIGPMSANLIEATFQLAKRKDFPILFIASRNQVDADEFGGGYVCSWNQETFKKEIDSIAEKCGFTGLYYLCRDHGGPWQRDAERNAKLPVKEAMELGKKSYLYDLKAGFDLLHIDPTKIPTVDGIVPMNLVLDYTMELIEFCELQRKKLNMPEVAYEVGTEETNGGLTGDKEYQTFIDTLVARLKDKDLPLPVFIVGQTGTLTRLTENVGHFNPITARKLSQIARVHGVGLKEHNGDYLSDFILNIHPSLGITATNVAPEYGVVESKTLLMLSDIESFLFQNGFIPAQSNFKDTFINMSIQSERWRKWMVGDQVSYTVEQVRKDSELSELIPQISGHYTFNNPSVKEEIKVMFRNLESAGLNPHRIMINQIMKSIDRYVDSFNLEGLTSKILHNLQ